MEAELLRGRRTKTHNAVIVEADELIQSWLEGVDKTDRENDDARRIPRYAWVSGATGPSSYPKVPNSDAALWQRSPEFLPLAEGEVDVSAQVEWEEGDVRDNARAVVEGLLHKTLRGVDGPKKVSSKHATCADPRIAMELRHKQVSERRRLKDIERAKSRELLERANEAQRMAEALVRREEEERRKRAKAEEALLREQMAAIRREMHEQRKAEKFLASVEHEAPMLSVVEQGEWLVSEGEREKRLAATRTALLEQLAESEALEAKANLKVLSQYFSWWQGAVAKQRANVRKAAAVGDWKLLLRIWRAWRGYVRKQSSQREQEAMARELQREKIRIDLAHQHHKTALLLRCFTAWRVCSKTGRLERRAGEERHIYQEKMAALLKVVSQASTVKPPIMIPQEPHRLAVTRKHSSKERDMKANVPPDKPRLVPEPSMWQVARQHVDNILAEAVKMLEKGKVEEGVEGGVKVEGVGGGVNGEEGVGGGVKVEGVKGLNDPTTEHGATVRKPHDMPQSQGAEESTLPSQTEGSHDREDHVSPPHTKDHVTPPHTKGHVSPPHTKGHVSPPHTKGHVSPPHTKDHVPTPPQSAQTQSSIALLPCPAHGTTVQGLEVRHSGKPPTKPITMTGMEARSRALAHRREEREQARKAREMEKLLLLKSEQEERERAEREAREAMAARRREEKRLAKQQELELQRRQEVLSNKNTKALSHYRLGLLKCWGMQPWRRLVEVSRAGQLAADSHYHLRTMKEVWQKWGHAAARRAQERDKMAADFFKRLTVKHSWRAWREYVVWCHELESLPVHHRQKVITAKVFRAWVRFVKEEALRQYEGEKKARLQYHRALQRSVFRGWRRYVPLSREEKTRELRRAELRRKVSAWLPDYQPREFMDTDPTASTITFDE